MLCRISSLGFFLIVLSLRLFAGSAGAQEVSPRCQTAMDTASGNYSRCLLRADAGSARHENWSKLEKRKAPCERHFDRRTHRAVRRSETGECPSSDLVAIMKDRTEHYAGANGALWAFGIPIRPKVILTPHSPAGWASGNAPCCYPWKQFVKRST